MREPLHETCADVSGLGQEYGTHWVCTSECPRPAGPDPERDARIEVYRDRERRRAARALDRYIDTIFPGHGSNPSEATAVANERFVEAVGDYVVGRLTGRWQEVTDYQESSLQQKSHYDVADDAPDNSPKGRPTA